MRVVFMGTPQLAANMMEHLSGCHEVVLAVTRPDAVSGRGGALRPSPVKAKAQELGIPVLTAKKLGVDETETLKNLEPDAICVAAYGCLLPDSILALPRYGCLNVHLSLLPRWRGAAPLERAILAGDQNIGFSVMRMESGLDTGPYCLQEHVLADDVYLADLEIHFAESGAHALAKALESIADGTVKWTQQCADEATYAEIIGKDELILEPLLTVNQNYARVRASGDAHPARTVIAGREVTVERAHPADSAYAETLPSECEAGTAFFVAKRLFLACRDGFLEVERLKPSGKASMEGKAFCAGVLNFKREPKPWGGIR